jgi:hypothetical protein
MFYELAEACPEHHVALTLGILTGYKMYAGLVFSLTVLSDIE